jgi:hypothetical protein
VMEAGEMVDASLEGFDQGELVTIPSLPDAADWKRFTEARAALRPEPVAQPRGPALQDGSPLRCLKQEGERRLGLPVPFRSYITPAADCAR